MERRCSSGLIGERLTPAIRTDAGASKSDLHLLSARLPFSTPANMIAGIVLVDDHSFLSLSSTPSRLLPNGMAFFKFISFRSQLFQNIPSTTNHKSIFHASRFFFCTFFSDIVIWPSRGPVYFSLSLCFCINFLPPPLPHHNPVSILLFRCSRAGPGDMAIGRPMYASTRCLML